MSGPHELPMLPMALPKPAAREETALPSAAAERYRVEGMDCASCAKTVEKAVAAMEGVRAARVSFGNATLAVEGEVGAERVQAVVSRAGYRAQPLSRRRAEPQKPFWRRDVRSVSTVASVVLLAVAVAATLAGATRAVAEPLYLTSMAVGGWAIARAALAGLRRGSLDMNVLMTLAAVGAVGIGSYAEGAWVLVLFAVGTTLESFAFDRSRRSVAELMDLAPEQARVIADDGSEHLVPVEEVTVGTRFVVRPGERIPLDGLVVDGASSVDEAPITGESVPVDKQPDSTVFAGTLNAQGALTVRTTSSAAESTLASVVALVEQAQGSRAPSERFVDRFARIYTPLVFAAALAVVVVPVALGGSVDTWLYRALALLIVACPCSLVISIPVAVVSAVGRAAREGVLIKGGQALEDLARVDTVAIDKTGTLTAGTPELADIEVLDGDDSDAVLALVATVERRSEHPLAESLVRAARARGVHVGEPEAFEALPGRGVLALVGGRELWAGGPRLVSERLGAAPDAVAALEGRGQTAIVLGEGHHALAVFGLADAPRPEAAAAIADLRRAGVGRIVMLTGDNERVAAAVAGAVGLDEFRAGLLPEDKLRAVETLNAERGSVAMVGDGINDAPALAAAPVGIAMGAAGADVALQSADVALMSDDLARLPDALTGARQATRVMRQNVIASLVVKAIFVVLAPLGLVTLVLAVAADMGMSLLVTLNGLRLLRRRSTGHAGHAADRRVAHASTRTPSAARSHGSGGSGDGSASER
ncbi:MAG: cation-translocating P-type ATPase [Solirubrobacteraceae bacterium]